MKINIIPSQCFIGPQSFSTRGLEKQNIYVIFFYCRFQNFQVLRPFLRYGVIFKIQNFWIGLNSEKFRIGTEIECQKFLDWDSFGNLRNLFKSENMFPTLNSI